MTRMDILLRPTFLFNCGLGVLIRSAVPCDISMCAPAIIVEVFLKTSITS